MSLIVVFTNDGTGDEETGNYDVNVYINKTWIASTRIENHKRHNEGWKDLVKELADKFAGTIVCPICKGDGNKTQASFTDPSVSIKRWCATCKGKGHLRS